MELSREAGSGLHWSKCECDIRKLELAHRAPWMRLFFRRRLYFCRSCRQHMLIPVPDLRRPR